MVQLAKRNRRVFEPEMRLWFAIPGALISFVFVRNALSVVIMFSFTPWITNMGVRNASILISLLVIVLLSFPLPLLIWDKNVRIKTVPRYKRYARL